MRARNAALFLSGLLLGGVIWAVYQNRQRWLPIGQPARPRQDSEVETGDTADCASFI